MYFQLGKIATKYKTEEKTKLEFLHSLYQQLLMGQSVAKPPDGSMLANFTWSELAILINEQAAVVVNSLHRAEEKVRDILFLKMPPSINVLHMPSIDHHLFSCFFQYIFRYRYQN